MPSVLHFTDAKKLHPNAPPPPTWDREQGTLTLTGNLLCRHFPSTCSLKHSTSFHIHPAAAPVHCIHLKSAFLIKHITTINCASWHSVRFFTDSRNEFEGSRSASLKLLQTLQNIIARTGWDLRMGYLYGRILLPNTSYSLLTKTLQNSQHPPKALPLLGFTRFSSTIFMWQWNFYSNSFHNVTYIKDQCMFTRFSSYLHMHN